MRTIESLDTSLTGHGTDLPWPTHPWHSRHGAVTLGTSLAGQRPGLSALRESLKLRVRAGLNLAETRAWLPFWNSSPLLARLAHTQPSVLKKIYRPYLSSRLGCRGRLDALMSHYGFITHHGLEHLVLHAASVPRLLAEFAGRSGSTYRLELLAAARMEREGELVLQLLADSEVIYSLAFTFIAHKVPPVLAVGCLQGGRSDTAREKIRFATRDLHGLRPKTLLLRLAQQIGRQFGCRDLLLVGNRNRVVHQQIRKGQVFADYDASWIELGATARPDGDYVLACTALAAPDLAAMASNKRSEARKRYATLVQVAGQVGDAFACDRAPGAGQQSDGLANS